MFHYTSCGLDNIWLRNGYKVKETKHGEAVAIHDVEGLHNAIGLRLVDNKPKLTGGEIRFLRAELDLPQKTLADLLGVGETSVRGWENDRTPISPAADRLLRMLYKEHVLGDGRVRELIERISTLHRDLRWERLEMEEVEEGGWRAAA